MHSLFVAVLPLLRSFTDPLDSLASQLKLESFMSAFTDELLALFHGLPTWSVSARLSLPASDSRARSDCSFDGKISCSAFSSCLACLAASSI